YGLERTTASNAVFLPNSESRFTMLFAYAFLGERATRREYVALGGIAVGAFIVATELRFGDVQFLQFLIGNLMLIGAAVCWGVSNTTSTVLLRRIPIVALLEIQLLFGAASFAAILVVSNTPVAVPIHILPVLVLLAVSAVGVFSVLFFYAFRTIGAMRSGAVLQSLRRDGVRPAVHLSVGRISADSDSRALNVGWATLKKALAGTKQATLLPRPLTILEATRMFAQIAEARGPDSTRARRRLLESLLGRASEEERDVLLRNVFGEMRI